MGGLNVTQAEIIRANNAALRAGLHTSMPGVIKSYNPLTKTADVLPVIKTPLYEPETGAEDEAEELPVIPNVPVSFPRGGGWHLSFPLQAGDHVTLVFSESATGQWRESGEVSDPGDVRRHSLGYPTAFLGAHPDADVLTDDTFFAGHLVLGKDGDPTQSIRIGPAGIEIGGLAPIPLAIGPAVATGLAAIATYLAALTLAITNNPTNFPSGAVKDADLITFGGTVATALGTAVAATPATISKGQ